jgi:hypothetical protein
MKLRLKPKLVLRSPHNNATTSPFDALVQEAVEVTQRLRALDANPAEGKLTPDAFLRECMKLGETITLQSIAKLKKALAKSLPSLMHSNASLRRMISALKGPTFSRPPPAKHLDRTIRWLDTTPSIAQLIQVGSSTLELLCVAIQIAGEQHPECFGRRESTQEIDAERATLTAKRDELFRRIATEVTAADLFIDDTATKPVAFALAPTVPLAPKANCAERLVNHQLAQEQRTP